MRLYWQWLNLVLLLALSLNAGAAGESTVGRLGDIEITAEEVLDSLNSLSPGQRESVRADPKLVEQIVRSSLVQKLVFKEAQDKKWHEQPKVVAKLARSRDSVITESYLEDLAQPPASYPDEAELKSAYEANRERLKQPPSYRLAQIFIAEAKGAEAKLAEIEALLKVKKADFAQIAKEQSQETVSAARGGEIGWVSESQIDPELRAQVEKLKLAEISAPVRLKDGWHILKLLDARASYSPTFEQVRPQLTQQLRQEKLRANSQAYLAKLLKEHPLSIQSAALEQLLKNQSSTSSRP